MANSPTIEREQASELSRRHWVGEDEAASEAVVHAVATASDTEPDSLPALGERVDAESLDELFSARDRSTIPGLIFVRAADGRSSLRVEFEYAGYDVTVTENYVVLD